jgi:hypothetical protein
MRSTLVRTASRLALAIGLFAALVWLADTLSLSFRIPPRDPLGSFQVRKMYAVKKKNGSTEFFFDDPAPETCVNALLPHQGYRPCWWVSRHTQPRVDVCSDCSVTPTRDQ